MGGIGYLYRLRIPRMLRASRRYIFFAVFLFLCGVVMGFYLFKANPAATGKVIDVLISKFKHLNMEMEGLSLWGRVKLVFWNNLRVALLCVLSGVLLGIIPMLVVFVNGFFIGAISANAARRGVDILTFLLVGVAPHGIFEIPAFLLGGVLGIRLGFNILAYERGSQRGRLLKRVIGDILLAFFTLIIPLLGLAAFVEMTVTRFLVRWVLGPSPYY